MIWKAKSCNNWTVNDLEDYSISVVSQSSFALFGVGVDDLPHHTDLINNATADEMENEDSFEVLNYMDLVMDPTSGEESALDDFAIHLLRTMGYARRGTGKHLRRRKDIPLLICGEWKHRKADVCVMTKGEILLLIQDASTWNRGIPVPQLIAKAIAAVQNNNQVRHILGLDALDFKEMPGIIMIGTAPTFFKIPVTRELLQAVQRGQYTPTCTVVAMHQPNLPRPLRRFSEGMRPLDNRRIIPSCFEAFKKFMDW